MTAAAKHTPGRVNIQSAHSVVTIGTIVQIQDGYVFVPWVSGHKSSRKIWPTADECVPQWARAAIARATGE